MPDPLPGVAQGVGDRALLDVHVIDVRLHPEIEPQLVDVVDCLVDRRQHPGEALVGVQRLQQDGDAAARGVLADLADRLPEVVAQPLHRLQRKRQLRDRGLGGAQLGEARPGIRRQVYSVPCVLHGARPRLRVGAGEVALLAGVVVAPGRQDLRDDEAGLLHPPAPGAAIHLLRVARQIDAVVPRFRGGLQNHIRFLEEVVPDPGKGVALQAVFERHDVRNLLWFWSGRRSNGWSRFRATAAAGTRQKLPGWKNDLSS